MLPDVSFSMSSLKQFTLKCLFLISIKSTQSSEIFNCVDFMVVCNDVEKMSVGSTEQFRLTINQRNIEN